MEYQCISEKSLTATYAKKTAKFACPFSSSGQIAFGLFLDPRGVDKKVLIAVIGEFRIYGVPGGAGDIADDDPFLSEQGVHQSGLAGVGLSHHGDLALVFGGDGLFLLREKFHRPIQQVPHAVSVLG